MVSARQRVYQLGGDANAISTTTDTPFKHTAHTLSPDLRTSTPTFCTTADTLMPPGSAMLSKRAAILTLSPCTRAVMDHVAEVNASIGRHIAALR